MPLHYFARETDPSMTVYEVDFESGTWRIFGAADGQPNACGWLIDGGESFYSFYFVRLDMVEIADDTVAFRRAVPRVMH